MATIYRFPKHIVRCASVSEVQLNLNLLRNGMIRGLTLVRDKGVWTMTVYSHQEIIHNDMAQAVANNKREYGQ